MKIRKIVSIVVLSMTTIPAVAATSSPAAVLAQPCNGCHGPDGNSSGNSIPTIAGLNVRYLMKTMNDFRKEERKSTIMSRLAKGYKARELRKIAGYFSEMQWRNAPVTLDPQRTEQAKKIHKELCKECHEDMGRFQDKEVPRLAGQWPQYTYFQLLDYQGDPERMPQPPKMKERLEKLSKDDLLLMSEFYGSVK